MKPKLSIVVPTFNSVETITSCLRSIQEQTYQLYEILIIDGGSTDGTVSKASDFLKNDKRIHWYSESDKGVYDAMNKGIVLAKGEWIYFLGSDDKLYNKTVLSDLFSTLDINNYDVVYGNVYSEHFNGIYDGEFTIQKLMSRNICHQSIFLKKTVFDKVGNFDLRYKAYSDWDHNLRWFFRRQIKKLYINQVIADYAEGGLSSRMGDSLFDNVRQYKYLIHVGRRLPLKKRISLLKEEYRRVMKGKNRKLLFKLILSTPKICIGA